MKLTALPIVGILGVAALLAGWLLRVVIDCGAWLLDRCFRRGR